MDAIGTDLETIADAPLCNRCGCRRVTPNIAPAPIEITGHRVLATFVDYDGLHRAMRARIDELEITRMELDHLAGFPDRYAGKLFGNAQIRKFGKHSLGPTVGALGCYLALVEETATESMPMLRKKSRKNFSLINMGERLAEIGCMIALVEDPVATSRMMARAEKRKLPIPRYKLLPPPRALAIETDMQINGRADAT